MITLESSYMLLSLPDPVLGDSEQIDVHSNIQFTMGMTVRTSLRSGPHNRRLLRFVNLDADQKADFIDFIVNSRNEVIVYTDYLSVAHTGLILPDTLDVTDEGRSGDGEHYSITLEFEDKE
jgi:hypothetical protein